MATTNLHNAADQAWSRASAREPTIRKLAALSTIPDAEMRSAIAELSLGRSQIYHLVTRYRADPVASSLIGMSPGPPKGQLRLADEVERLIDRLIQEVYLAKQKPTVAALYAAVRHECFRLGKRPPSRTAVAARVRRLKPSTILRTREGRKAADDVFCPVAHSYQADHALQVVQIDHTLVDQIIVDDQHRQPLGRPWLTVGIDIASRMITGFYLTLESPSAVSVAMAMRHAVLPKAVWLAEQGIVAPWPVSGFPDRLHMDNAKEFHSRALARGCGEYGIAQQFRPRATPHFGGHIERLIGTMMGAVHLLPGTTFSNIDERGAYGSAANAAMTLAELETWIAIQIVGVYHADLHRGLGRPPNAAWELALACRPQPPRHPPDPDRFLFDFLPFEYRKVRRDGIQLFNIRYWDPVLTTWLGEKKRMPVKYDVRNLSRVFLQGPDGKHWPIPYADLGRRPITRWEHERASKLLREEGRAAVNEQLIFEAVEAQRALVAGAIRRTIKARRVASRTAHAIGATTANSADLQKIDVNPEADSDDRQGQELYLPYPMEDW